MMKTYLARSLTEWRLIAVALLGAVVMAVPTAVAAAELYVSAGATPEAPYDTWDTGFNSLQAALDHAGDGDTIYIAGETFTEDVVFNGGTVTNDFVFLLQNKNDITLKGGYEGVSGTPGLRDPDAFPTVLRRDTNDASVLKMVSVSNIVVEAITIRDGNYALGAGVYMEDARSVVFDNCKVIENISPASVYGGYFSEARGNGFYLVNSDLVITNSVVADNGAKDGSRPSPHGGGLYLANSSVLLTHSLLSNNELISGRGSSQGGGAYIAAGGQLTVLHSTVSNNIAQPGHQSHGYAGGIFVANGAQLIVRDATITRNEARRASRGASGGGLYVATGGEADLLRVTFSDNKSTGDARVHPPGGGAIQIQSGGLLELRESVLTGNVVEGSDDGRGGAIANYGGTALLRNVLIAGNKAVGDLNLADAIYSGTAAALTALNNVTLVDNHVEDPNNIGALYDGGEIAVTNTIFWGHTFDLVDFPTDGSGNLPDVWYSNIGDGQNAGVQGCLSVDPLFADSTYYHLQSTEGHYSGGYFSGGTWTTAAGNSPLIDRGDPNSDYSREPEPNGERINMGAYGNTEVAAKTAEIEVSLPTVVNHGALAWGHRTAILRGEVTDDGGQLPEVVFQYWPVSGVVTSSVPAGLQSGSFSFDLSGLTSGTDYLYRFSAENNAGLVWSDTEAFSTQPPNAALYVSTNGNHTAGADWATAYQDLQTAFDIAEPGDTILLAGHDFTGEPGPLDAAVFLLSDVENVVIKGGYQATDGTPGARDPDVWPTVLKRSVGDVSVLKLNNVSNVVVDAVTIREGNSESGAGVYLSDARDVVFRDCRIIDNVTLTSSPRGMGFYLIDGDLLLTNCVVAFNIGTDGPGSSHPRGGGAYVGSGGRLTVRQSTFEGNQSHADHQGHAYGGGFFVDNGGLLEVLDSAIIDNWARRASRGASGGGLYVAAGGEAELLRVLLSANKSHADSRVHPPGGGGIHVHEGGLIDIRDSILVENEVIPREGHTGFGGAIANYGGTALLRNVLIAGNKADGEENFADGIYASGVSALTVLNNVTLVDNHVEDPNNIGVLYDGGEIAVTNSILWGHAFDLSNLPEGAGVLLNVSHSMFATHDTGGPMHGVNGCITEETPVFTMEGEHPYRLQQGSPGINAGINFPWMTDATDLAGLPRVMVGIVDMGCYETIPPTGSIIRIR